MRLNWKQDEDAIATLNRLGIDWSPRIISAAHIDVTKSRHNHARQQAINPANVEDYRDAMRRGDTFPMIVVAQLVSGGKYVIAGGNHRHEAAVGLGVTEFDVVAVCCSEREFALLCPALNLYVGQREDRAVRVRQAAEAVLRTGIANKQAAEDYQVPESSVSNAVAVMKVIVHAATHGHNLDRVQPGILRAIAGCMNDDALFPKAVELVKTKLSGDEIREVMKKVRAQRTEKAKVDLLTEAVKQAKQITIGGRIARLPTRSMLMRSVAIIKRHITKEATLCSLQMTQQDVQQIATQLRLATTELARLADIDG